MLDTITHTFDQFIGITIVMTGLIGAAGIATWVGLAIHASRQDEDEVEPSPANEPDEQTLAWHRVVGIRESDDRSHPPRLLIQEGSVRIPVDAPRALAQRLHSTFHLNPGATLDVKLDVHPTALKVRHHGALRITPPDGTPVQLETEGVYPVVSVFRYANDESTHVTIKRGGARFPVACDKTLAESIRRLREENEGLVVHLDGRLDADATRVVTSNTFRITDTFITPIQKEEYPS